MSLVKVSSSISELTSFIKEKTVSNLVESRNNGVINIDDVEFQKMVGIIDQSFSQALSLGYSNVEAVLSEYLNESK